MIVVFKEAFPLACDERKRNISPFNPRSLDASRIQLDSAYLAHADLRMPGCERRLLGGRITDANLSQADLRKADLTKADLSDTPRRCHFRKARLEGADLRKARLEGADLSATNLREVDLRGANLSRVNLSPGGRRGGIDPTPADLSGSNPEDAQTLEGTDLRGVIGLTKGQLEACKAKGAIIDEDFYNQFVPVTRFTYPTFAKQRCASLIGPNYSGVKFQGSIAIPDTSRSSVTSSQQCPEP